MCSSILRSPSDPSRPVTLRMQSPAEGLEIVRLIPPKLSNDKYIIIFYIIRIIYIQIHIINKYIYIHVVGICCLESQTQQPNNPLCERILQGKWSPFFGGASGLKFLFVANNNNFRCIKTEDQIEFMKFPFVPCSCV